MAFSIVFGLAILSVTNYGNTFEFSGLDSSLQSKFKSITKPFSSLNVQPRFGEQVKPTFGFKNVDAKPFGTPFDPFKQSYQHYQPGPLRTNYQPFGPYPGYPGPVVYPGQAPSAYPQPSYRFDNPSNKPFGFQPFSAPTAQPFSAPTAQPFSAPAAQPAFNPYKFGLTKKFNKFAELSDFNQPGKYFQQHQFGAYHGPEFSSAIVPAEHNIKQSRPKETLLGKPVIPSFSEFGLPKQNPFGIAPPSSFKYPVLQYPPQFQPFVSTAVPSVNSIPTTAVPESFRFSSTAADAAAAVSTAAPSSSEESATARASEVTDEPSATPAADPQPTGPSQEEVTASDPTAATAAAAEIATDNEAPAAVEQSQQSSQAAEGGEPNADDKPTAQVVDSEEPVPVVVEEQVREDKPADQEVDPQLTGSSPVVVEPAAETSSPVNDATESSTVSGSDSSSNTAGKTEEAVKESLTENKPTESGASAVNLPGLPNELYGALPPASDPASLGLFGSSGFPYFGQSAEFQQPPYFPYYDAPKFSDEELKLFAANFGSDALAFPPAAQAVEGANVAVKDAESVSAGPVPVSTETSVPVSSTPLVERVVKIESVDKAESSEKKEPTGGESESRNIPEAPKRNNAVQIVQEDPFNGQLPLLFDPSNTASPLNTFKFYNHPSVSALSSQAAVASYSPEDAFANFGSQFRQGYLVEGSPTLTAVPKTILQLSNQTPVSISSADHPLHSQVFKYSQSFVPYPGLVPAPNTHVYRSLEVPSSSSTVADAPLPLATDPTSAAVVASSTTEAAASAESDGAATTVAA